MTWRLYNVARESLAYVAKYNGNNEDKIDDRIRDVAFIKEFKEHELLNITGIEPSTEENPEGEGLEMGPRTYFKHLFLLSILWTNTIFSYNVLKFMTSKLDGNIFLNFYLDGISGIIGYSIAKPIYKYLRLRWTIFISVSITVFFLVWLLVFQE